MSSKKAAKALRKTNLLSNIADETGVSKSNFFVRLTNPADEVLRDTEREGTSGWTNYMKEGGMTDPLHVFHGNNPDNPDPGAAPAVSQTDLAQNNIRARDRIRRQVYGAKGRASTIKVGQLAQSYTGQPKSLLGS